MIARVKSIFCVLVSCSVPVFFNFCNIMHDDISLNRNMLHWMTNIKVLYLTVNLMCIQKISSAASEKSELIDTKSAPFIRCLKEWELQSFSTCFLFGKNQIPETTKWTICVCSITTESIDRFSDFFFSRLCHWQTYLSSNFYFHAIFNKMVESKLVL